MSLTVVQSTKRTPNIRLSRARLATSKDHCFSKSHDIDGKADCQAWGEFEDHHERRTYNEVIHALGKRLQSWMKDSERCRRC